MTLNDKSKLNTRHYKIEHFNPYWITDIIKHLKGEKNQLTAILQPLPLCLLDPALAGIQKSEKIADIYILFQASFTVMHQVFFLLFLRSTPRIDKVQVTRDSRNKMISCAYKVQLVSPPVPSNVYLNGKTYLSTPKQDEQNVFCYKFIGESVRSG